MDEQDARRHPWDPPEDGPWAAGAPTAVPDAPDADGPPPPPWVARRRRRRRAVGVVAVVALLVAVPVGLLWAGVFDRPDGDAAQGVDPDVADPGDPDVAPDPEATLEAPDPARFTGSDADFATVLRGVEASERTMMRFQADLAEAFALAGTDDPDPFLAAVRSAAETGAGTLTEARGALDEPLRTAPADEVRQVYLAHLDAWLALMEATAGEPSLFGPTGDTARFDIEINATALDFSRTLESALPGDAADEITRFAEQLLDRGFRFDTEAQV
ncbi:MAG TPA: hypothetical protein VK906_03880 [Egicoccus sp.]|nr:hypothetical protein [Egicoccus sp.]HSK22286.1 hypothetical protein [Egicoccus sp.]